MADSIYSDSKPTTKAIKGRIGTLTRLLKEISKYRYKKWLESMRTVNRRVAKRKEKLKVKLGTHLIMNEPL